MKTTVSLCVLTKLIFTQHTKHGRKVCKKGNLQNKKL